MFKVLPVDKLMYKYVLYILSETHDPEILIDTHDLCIELSEGLISAHNKVELLHLYGLAKRSKKQLQ